MPDLIVQKIEVPLNEPQPDRSAQLDNDLSKLFESPLEDTVKESKPEIKENLPEEEIEDEPKEIKSNEDKNKIQEVEKVQEEIIPPKSSKEGWKVLRESHAKAKKTILEKDEELKKLKVSLAEKGQVTSQEAEKLKKEIEELKSYRAMVDIQADPEFLEKFDNPINKKTEHLAKMLSEWNVDKEVINKIDYTDSGLLDRMADTIGEVKDKISAKKFLRQAEEINELYDKRTEHLDEYRKNYKDLLESKKKETSAKQAENEGRIQKRLSEISELKDEKGNNQFPFLNEISPKDPSNVLEVQQVERHNKAVAFMKQKLETALKAESPEEKAEVAVAAVAAHWTNAQLKAALKKIESLQAELGKISKSSSETPRTKRTPSINGNGNGDLNLDLDHALNNFRATI